MYITTNYLITYTESYIPGPYNGFSAVVRASRISILLLSTFHSRVFSLKRLSAVFTRSKSVFSTCQWTLGPQFILSALITINNANIPSLNIQTAIFTIVGATI